MAPTASTLYKQQSRYNGKLTREYSASGTGTIYWSSAETLGITAGWFQIDAENTKGEEVFVTGITGTPAEYSGTVVIRGLRDYGANTNVPAKQFVHRATASIIISDNHSWQDQMVDAFLAHEQLQTAFHGFAGIGTDAARPVAAAGNSGMIYWSTDGLIMYYSDGSTWTAQSAGTQPDSTTSVKGVVKMSVAPVSAANPIAVGDNDTRITSASNMTDLTDGGDSTLHFHSTDRARANHTGTQALSTILESGTAGETLAADQLVYLKSSDSKLYKATQDITSDANAWDAIGIIVTGGVLDATVTFRPLIGTTTLASPLVANTVYYLGTGGALTATRPAMNSATIIPMRLGKTDGTARMNWKVQRLQRRKFVNIFNTFGTGNYAETVTVGFSMSYVEAHSQSIGTTIDGFGYFDVLSSTQTSNNFGSNTIGGLHTSGHTLSIAAAVDGSNNLALTGTASAGITWTGSLYLKIFEAL